MSKTRTQLNVYQDRMFFNTFDLDYYVKILFIFTFTSVFYTLTKEFVEFVSQGWRLKRITHNYIFDKTFPETITLKTR